MKKKCWSENDPFQDGKILCYKDQEVQLKLSCKLIAILKDGGRCINREFRLNSAPVKANG